MLGGFVGCWVGSWDVGLVGGKLSGLMGCWLDWWDVVWGGGM